MPQKKIHVDTCKMICSLDVVIKMFSVVCGWIKCADLREAVQPKVQKLIEEFYSKRVSLVWHFEKYINLIWGNVFTAS